MLFKSSNTLKKGEKQEQPLLFIILLQGLSSRILNDYCTSAVFKCLQSTSEFSAVLLFLLWLDSEDGLSLSLFHYSTYLA